MKPTVKKNVDLTSLNTLGVHSIAPEFMEIQSADDLIELGKKGYFQKSGPFILGGGSNVLFKNNPDVPVLKISIPGIHILDETESEVIVKVGAGVNWHQFVKWTVENNYGGLENLALIPGTSGAAPIQNIGAYGVELSKTVEYVEFYHIGDQKIKRFNSDECRFGYRDSTFKNELKGKAVVTGLAVRLSKENHDIVDHYYALKEYLERGNIKSPGIQDVFEAVINIRKSKLPDPSLLGNAGSFFKNPIVEADVASRIQKEFIEVPIYDVAGSKKKIPAGWLIEQAGWKGKRVGNVGTYKNQALVIVNHGGATGKEIFEHALRIQKSVKEKFGIELTPEVNIVD